MAEHFPDATKKMDFISREAVIKYLKFCSGGYDYIETETKGAIDRINAIPASDVRPVVRGKWEIMSNPRFRRCSVCHDKVLMNMKNLPNFCDVCGADMRAANDRPYEGTDSSASLGMTTGTDGRVPSLRNDKEDEWKQSE